MTPEQQHTVFDLTAHRISKEEFLSRFGIRHAEGGRLALTVLEEACRQKSAIDVECGLLIGFHFGFTADHFDILCRLSDAEWHMRHEEVVSALGALDDARAVEALYRAALKLHPYLDYDDSRALAVKAIWALGGLRDRAADEKLRLLAQSDDPIVRENASEQLRYRQSERPV